MHVKYITIKYTYSSYIELNTSNPTLFNSLRYWAKKFSSFIKWANWSQVHFKSNTSWLANNELDVSPSYRGYILVRTVRFIRQTAANSGFNKHICVKHMYVNEFGCVPCTITKLDLTCDCSTNLKQTIMKRDNNRL